MSRIIGYDGSTALMQAASNGDMKLAKLLLDMGAHVDAGPARGWTPLMDAASDGQLELAKMLIAHGAEVNAYGEYHETPLTCAAGEGHLEMVRLLIEKGADVNFQEEPRIGNAALIEAARHGHLEVATLLIGKGAKVNAKGDDNTTPVWIAAHCGCAKIIRLLCERGADINATIIGGQTALMEASEQNLECVTMLVEKGANINAEDDDGETALDKAKKSRRWAIVAYLETHGAKPGKGKVPGTE